MGFSEPGLLLDDCGKAGTSRFEPAFAHGLRRLTKFSSHVRGLRADVNTCAKEGYTDQMRLNLGRVTIVRTSLSSVAEIKPMGGGAHHRILYPEKLSGMKEESPCE